MSIDLPSLKAVRYERARRDYREFKKHVWWMPHELVEGIHSRALGDRLTKAVRDFKQGKSTFLKVKMPFRHGKSDDVSRAFPAYALGELRAHDIDLILAGYGAELSETFSVKVQHIIQSQEYQQLYPDVRINKNRDAVRRWSIDQSQGEVLATGISGAITGRGGHVILIDDFFKNREWAESETYRDKVWNGLTNDILTRRAPVCIVIICATPWHHDDPFARIDKAMERDPDFPPFEDLMFPAESEDYPTGYLFPERWPESWYRSQRATLGKYAAAGLLDCAPKPREGNIFKVENIQYHDSIEDFPKGLRYRRGWDLASTEKQRTSADPDWSVGTKADCTRDKNGALHVWVPDAVRCREEAPVRDRLIESTHNRDGGGIEIRIEAIAGYKDAYTTMRNKLRGKAIVKRVGAMKDKVSKLSFLEAPFEAGHVHLLRGEWNGWFVEQFRTFPKGHDDAPDSLYAAIEDYARLNITAFDRSGVGI